MDINQYITEKLFSLKDEKYGDFQYRLTPTIQRNSIIGVRVPEIRKLSKEIISHPDLSSFFNKVPHNYYDENMLHSILLSQIKDFNICLNEIDKFLPYVNNWAVCDVLSPKSFSKQKNKLIENIYIWCKSNKTYTIRFGIKELMNLFLDKDFDPKYNQLVSSIFSDEYYVNMMISWYFATALAKQYDSTIKYLENNKLNPWVHNKTIQKSVESLRITKDKKDYLKSLKVR